MSMPLSNRRSRELAGYTAHGSGSVVSKGLSVGDIYADAEQWEETRPAKSGRQELGEDAAQESLGNLPECTLTSAPLPPRISSDCRWLGTECILSSNSAAVQICSFWLKRGIACCGHALWCDAAAPRGG